MQNIRLSYILISLLCVSLFLSGCKTKLIKSEDSVVITFQDGAYSPKENSIKLNQTVTFNNKSTQDIWPASNIHPTHGIYPQFDPKKAIKPGESWSFTFTKAGAWKFHDHLQPTITGEILVEK